MIIDIIPANPIQAMAEGNILQLIFFGLFLGFGLSVLPVSKKQSVVNGFNTILEALIWCIGKVMLVAPLGVFGLMADATGTFGFDLLIKVGNLLWVNIYCFLFYAYRFLSRNVETVFETKNFSILESPVTSTDCSIFNGFVYGYIAGYARHLRKRFGR